MLRSQNFHAQKVLKMAFFYLKSNINEKISEEFFCFLFFLVVHMFLKTNDTVRENGYFNSLWGGIQRCVCMIANRNADIWSCDVWCIGVIDVIVNCQGVLGIIRFHAVHSIVATKLSCSRGIVV